MPPLALEDTDSAAYWTQYAAHDRSMVGQEAVPPEVPDMDIELAKTPRGSPRYKALLRTRLMAMMKQFKKLQNELYDAFSSTPIPFGGTYAPGNMQLEQQQFNYGGSSIEQRQYDQQQQEYNRDQQQRRNE
jgi:hypothetical protein